LDRLYSPSCGAAYTFIDVINSISFALKGHMAQKKLLLAALVLSFAQLTLAQTVCTPNLQSSMACVIPQALSPNGLTLPNPAHRAHFDGDFLTVVLPTTVAITTSVGTELALRSIASPASGVLFTFDKSLGTVTRSNESYGPILTERAETVGRHRIFLASTYEFRDFSSLDGVSLHHLPLALTHAQFHGAPGGLPAGDYVGCHVANGCPIYAEDYITLQDSIDLKAHEVTFYATYGLTSRVDISAAVPILDVRLGITSTATIHRVAPQPVCSAPGPGCAVVDPALFATTDNTGFYHFFDLSNPAGSLNAVFPNFKSATGIGDVVFRAKGTAWKGERARVAFGLDVRTPTGDAQNFLGSGAPGVKPFVAASYRARVSPHVNLGFEYNGQSILAGDVSTNHAGKLPNEFFYSAGVDVGVSKKLTVAADMLGTRLSSTERIRTVPYLSPVGGTVAAPTPTLYPNVPQIAVYRDAVDVVDISVGAKYSPWRNLLLTGNVTFKANDAGLRATAVPLVGASYSF
jgi:hypothetical protein